MIKPYQHQQDLMDFHEANGFLGTLGYHGMGLGKTLSALWSWRKQRAKLRMMGVSNPKCIIFAPKSATLTWQKECRTNTPDLIDSIIVLPYSQIHHAHNRLKYSDVRLVVFDEVHYLKGEASKINKASGIVEPVTQRVFNLAKFFRKLGESATGFAMGRLLLITGTPNPNGGHELYNYWAMSTANNIVEAAQRLLDHKNYTQWKQTFAKDKEVHWKSRSGGGRGKKYGGVKNPDMLNEIMVKFTHYRALEDCIDMPKSNVIHVDLNLPDDTLLEAAAQSGAIEEADANIDNHFMALQEKLARAKEPHLYNWIQEFVTNSNEQLIVFSQYTWPLYEIQKKFKGRFVIITGREKDIDRKQALEDFQEGRVQGIALSYRCGSESLNLQNAAYTVYHGFPWHDDALSQAMARTVRSGQKRQTYHYFLMSGENDKRIFNLVRSKKDANTMIRERLKSSAEVQQEIINNYIKGFDILL